MKRIIQTIVAIAAVTAAFSGCMTGAGSMERGTVYYNNGEYLSAIDQFSIAVNQAPRSAAPYNNRGIARVRVGDLGGAIEDYTHALALAPYDAEIYFNRGNALVAAGQYGPAVADFTRAVEISPTYVRAWFNRGTARTMLGQTDAAVADYRRAIDMEPDPWAKSAMRRSTGLNAAASVAPGATYGQPTTAFTVAPAPLPGTTIVAVPYPSAVAAAPTVTPQPSASVTWSPPPLAAAAEPPVVPQPAASVTSTPEPAAAAIDARALATRAIGRELDGDHAGALQDLQAAMAMENDPARRDSIANLLRLLDTPR